MERKNESKPVLHIGIVACSAEGAALCYRTICSEGASLLGPHGHPEISLHAPPLSQYVHFLEQGDWHGVGELMLQSAKKLALIGADFLICPDNTIHKALPLILGKSPLPWLHIAEIVAQKAAERKFHRVGILGTKWLVDSETYPQKLSEVHIEYVRPSPTERDELSRIIMEELGLGKFNNELSIQYFQRVIKRLRDEEQCDAVVLGCTEIPLIISDENSVLPTLDSTRLLARAALERAIGEGKRKDH